MLEEKYREKEEQYYGNTRKEFLPFIDKKLNRVLEIGCGSGETLSFLKNHDYCKFTIGVELFADAAQVAEGRVDQLFRSNIEDLNLDIEPESLDLILCLDVLEHLINPYQVIHYLHTLLTPSGSIIASIPNIRHYTASLPLLFQNKWEYQDCGILDHTHLRFFVRDTAIQLMQSSGLSLDKAVGINLGRKGSILNTLTFGTLESFLALQYLIKVTKSTSTT